MQLVILLSGTLEWDNPAKYERACWLNRGAKKSHLSYAPTSLDIFMPKESWSKETKRRFENYVTHTKCKHFAHKTALHTVYDEGQAINKTKNDTLMRAVQQGDVRY